MFGLESLRELQRMASSGFRPVFLREQSLPQMWYMNEPGGQVTINIFTAIENFV